MPSLGTFRAFFVVAVCCIGSFLFAYDTGIIGGVLTLKSFQDDFRYSNAHKTTVASNSNSLLQAGGAFFLLETGELTNGFQRSSLASSLGHLRDDLADDGPSPWLLSFSGWPHALLSLTRAWLFSSLNKHLWGFLAALFEARY
jgi:hypothetical protein